MTGRANGASIGRASKALRRAAALAPLGLEADNFGREPGDFDFGLVDLLLRAAALRVTVARDTRDVVHDPMQILGRADRLVGLVVLGEGDFDLFDRARPRSRGHRRGCGRHRRWPGRGCRSRLPHSGNSCSTVKSILFWRGPLVRSISSDVMRSVGSASEPAIVDARLRGFGIERARRKVGAETPRDRQHLLERGAGGGERDRRLGDGRFRHKQDRQQRKHPR